MKFVDIHSHIIFDVDDGSKTLEQSIKELEQIKKIGLEDVVCTPHFRCGNIDKIVKVKENYKKLLEKAKELNINLYLGNEILYSDKMIRLLNRNRLLTLNGTKYVLIEFKRNETIDISCIVNILEELIENGYKPVLAHPELYINYHSIEDMYKIKETGTMLQMDATNIIKNKTTRKIYKFGKKLLTEKLIDVVASDAHCTKKRNHLSYMKAYKKVSKKYGRDYANILFKTNPSLIIDKH